MVRESKGRGSVVLFSFGFKYGTPVDAQLVLDVRCLPNPYWDKALRPKTGLVDEVSRYVLESSRGQTFLEKIRPALEFMVNTHVVEDGHRLRLGIGCTGGRHRSVATAEKIGSFLEEMNIPYTLFHRDIDRDVP